MDEIVTEHAGSILRIQLNARQSGNAMTSAMYLALAGIFNEAANDENTRVVLWHGAGDSFCAGNDIEISQESSRAGRNRRQVAS